MKSKLSISGLLIAMLFSFSSCKKNTDDPTPTTAKTSAKTATTNTNKFTIDGDGFITKTIDIDTADHSIPYTYCYGNRFADSLQLGVSGAAMVNGTNEYVSVYMGLHYTGIGTYTAAANDCNASILIGWSNPAHSYSSNSSLTITITRVDPLSGYIEGTYSGVFTMDSDPTKTVTITNGELVTVRTM